MNYATQDGSKVGEDFFDKITEKIDEILVEIQEKAENIEEDQSVGDLLNEEFENLLKILVENENFDDSQCQIARTIFEARLKEERNDTTCSDLSKLSVKGWAAYEDCEGDRWINLKYGYAGLVNHLKSKLANTNILLNEVVSKIDYSGDRVEVLSVNSKSSKNSKFSAKYCLSTVPLGYLKANYKNLFKPSLPTEKVQAIEKLGFGLLQKFFILFDGQPFENDTQGFQVLWRNDRKLKLKASTNWNHVSKIKKEGKKT